MKSKPKGRDGIYKESEKGYKSTERKGKEISCKGVIQINRE